MAQGDLISNSVAWTSQKHLEILQTVGATVLAITVIYPWLDECSGYELVSLFGWDFADDAAPLSMRLKPLKRHSALATSGRKSAQKSLHPAGDQMNTAGCQLAGNCQPASTLFLAPKKLSVHIFRPLTNDTAAHRSVLQLQLMRFWRRRPMKKNLAWDLRSTQPLWSVIKEKGDEVPAMLKRRRSQLPRP